MSEVNTTRFYQFLSQYDSKGGWNEVADTDYGNDDGYVIKSEFRKFIEAEWNGEENGEVTNDLVNTFWKKINTNTSTSKISGTSLKNSGTLDKNEIANLEKRLELYVQLDEFIASNVQIPSALTSTGSQWKADISEKLSAKLEAFVAAGCAGDLDAILLEEYNAIKNQTTAEYCAVEYQETLKNGILADYQDYKVADDSTLQGLINAYIASIDTETDADTIKEDIMSIMDAYFATAGLGTDSGYDIEALGFKGDKLNDIQKAVITQTIKNDLADEAKNYEGYEEQFNTAVQNFIDDKIKKGGSFEELKTASTEFANSEFKKNLDNLITIDKTYKDVVEGSDFYKVLQGKFGNTLADKIAKNDKYLTFYQEIITEVVNKVNNGEMTMDEIQDYVLEKISQNLDKFFTNGLGDMSLEELNSLYDQLAAAAEAQTDTEEGLKQHRDAAIKYCDALVKKGGKLKEAVIDAFGSDYKSAINNMYPGDIATIMTELKDRVLDIGDVSAMTEAEKNALFAGINDTYELSLGQLKTFNVANTAKVGNSTITSDRFTYSASGCLTVDEKTGKVTVDTSKAGTYSGNVYVYIDGVKVATKTVTVAVKEVLDLSKSEVKFQDSTLSDHIVSGNKVVMLSDWVSSWGDFRANSKRVIKNLITEAVESLKAAGYSADKLERAATTTINYYYAFIDQVGDYNKDSSVGSTYYWRDFTYTDADGNTHTASDCFEHKTKKKEKHIQGGERAAEISHNSSGISMNESYNNTNTYKLWLNTGVLLEKFQYFFNNLK